MWRSCRRLAQRFRARPAATQRSRATSHARNLGIAAATGTVCVWSLPIVTLLDDGSHARDERRPSIANASLSEDCMKAYRNAKTDPKAAREATFQQAEAFLGQSGFHVTDIGSLPVDETIIYIFQRMGIAKFDIRYWTLSPSSQLDSPIQAVYLAANLNPDDMNNHMIMTTALQFEMDRLREGGKLAGENGSVKAMIQYRDVVVELEYTLGDGRFTPVIRNAITGRRVKFEPLERMRIEIDGEGMPLLMPEGQEQRTDNKV